MKTFLLSFLLFLTSAGSRAQVPYILEKEFKDCLKRSFSEKDFMQFYHILDSLETVPMDISAFKAYKIYSTSISNLLHSVNYYQKGIAYRLLASLKDGSYNSLLLERMKIEDNKFLRTLNAASVMKLMPKQTTITFDFLVDCEDFATHPLIGTYLAMDEKSIIKTAYARVHDRRLKAKVFALQILARFDPDPKVDELIAEALKDWDVSIKGYAVVALGVHRSGNYKSFLAPYVKEAQLREVIIETLEKSSVAEDLVFAEQLKHRR